MKKAGFIGSVASVLLGSMTLVTTSIINTVMPKIGYLEFQKLSSGSYAPEHYVMNFAFANAIACLLILCGLGFGAYCFISGQRTK